MLQLLILVEKCQLRDIRLFGSDFHSMGRVEMCFDGYWKSVCRSSFDNVDASIVCGQLGYSKYG